MFSVIQDAGTTVVSPSHLALSCDVSCEERALGHDVKGRLVVKLTWELNVFDSPSMVQRTFVLIGKKLSFPVCVPVPP